MPKFALHSRGPIPHLLELMFGLLAAWGFALWFVLDVSGRAQGRSAWIAAMLLYCAMAASIYVQIRIRVVRVEGDRLAWSHIPAQAVRGGFFPSRNGSVTLESIDSVNRIQNGDFMIRLADGSHLILDTDEFDQRRAERFADQLAARLGRTVEARDLTFDEAMNSLSPDVRHELEARIRRPNR